MRIASRTVLILSLLAPVAGAAQAQFFKSLTDAAKKAAEEETTSQVDRLVRDGVACAFNDFECIRSAEEAGEEVLLTDAAGNPIVDKDGNPVQDPDVAAEMMDEGVARPGEGAWANYDFIPGDSVLFYEDYAEDEIGDFPLRLEWVRGNMEIVEWQGRRLLRATGSDSRLAVVLPDSLPQRFTIEFEISDPSTDQGTRVITTDYPRSARRYDPPHVNIGSWRGSGIWEAGDPLSTLEDERMTEQLVTARIMADGGHVKVYLDETRIANVPRIDLARGNRVTFAFGSRADAPIYLGSIRIAAGGRDLYDDLVSEGRVATQGILFAVGSDRLSPESTPTLDEIGSMLEQHGGLRITIEGHTDSQGDESHNLDLSRRRAESVRQFLVEAYGVDGGRLEAVGFGETKPVADNGTPEGRQQNRRVELVVLGN